MINLEVRVPEPFFADQDGQTPREFWESMIKHAETTDPKLKIYRDEDGSFFATKVPMIIIVNGAGGTGKDTVTELVMEGISSHSTYRAKRMSTVDLVYKSINDVFLANDFRGRVKADIQTKGDAWRQFMHEVKMSWTKYCDGPIQYILDTVYQDITAGLEYTFYFVMCREAEEIKRFINIIGASSPYLYSTIFVKGITDADTWQNDCDHNVREELFDYDIVIENHENDLAELHDKCEKLASRLIEFYDTCSSIPLYKNRALLNANFKL